MAGLFPNGFMPAIHNNSQTLLQTGLGLLSGQTGPQQAALGAQGFASARQAMEEKQKQNRTLQFLQQQFPEIASYVQAGMPANEALKLAYEQKHAQTPKPTSDIQEYNFAKNQGFTGTLQDWITQNKKAGATNVTTNVGGETFDKQLQKDLSGTVIEDLGKAKDAARLSSIINEGRTLLDQGMITGAGADYKVGALKLAKAVGVDVPLDAANNTQTFQATMGQAVGAIIKQFGSGTGLSDADRKYAERIAGGDVTLDEAAIRRIFDIADKASRAQVKAWNDKVPQILQGDIGGMLTVGAPDPYSPPPARVPGSGDPEIDMLLQKYGTQ